MNNYQRFLGPGLAVIAALVVAALLGAPVVAYLPIGLAVLACPLMMFFMMRGMHGGHGAGATDQPAPGAREGEPR